MRVTPTAQIKAIRTLFFLLFSPVLLFITGPLSRSRWRGSRTAVPGGQGELERVVFVNIEQTRVYVQGFSPQMRCLVHMDRVSRATVCSQFAGKKVLGLMFRPFNVRLHVVLRKAECVSSKAWIKCANVWGMTHYNSSYAAGDRVDALILQNMAQAH